VKNLSGQNRGGSLSRMDRCKRRNHYTLIKTQEHHNEDDRVDEELVVGIFHHPDLHRPSGRWRIYDVSKMKMFHILTFTLFFVHVTFGWTIIISADASAAPTGAPRNRRPRVPGSCVSSSLETLLHPLERQTGSLGPSWISLLHSHQQMRCFPVT